MRNVLIDFGSSEASGFSPDLLTIAEQIKADYGGELDMVVATHRHFRPHLRLRRPVG